MSNDSEIVYNKNGELRALNGKDAVSLMQISHIISGIKMHVETDGRMQLTRGASISYLLELASRYTAKKYRVRKKEDYIQAVKDLQIFFDNMKAALPIREVAD